MATALIKTSVSATHRPRWRRGGWGCRRRREWCRSCRRSVESRGKSRCVHKASGPFHTLTHTVQQVLSVHAFIDVPSLTFLAKRRRGAEHWGHLKPALCVYALVQAMLGTPHYYNVPLVDRRAVRTSGPRRACRRTGRGHRCSRSPRTPTRPDDADGTTQSRVSSNEPTYSLDTR